MLRKEMVLNGTKWGGKEVKWCVLLMQWDLSKWNWKIVFTEEWEKRVKAIRQTTQVKSFKVLASLLDKWVFLTWLIQIIGKGEVLSLLMWTDIAAAGAEWSWPCWDSGPSFPKVWEFVYLCYPCPSPCLTFRGNFQIQTWALPSSKT